ncbi:GrpB family protein [Actinoplanes flavus]|uniref:GrpB family protein n=1 Tax=Actinoplanes flavus TaxID=2820290 RepID=A0ABS3UIT5_9ACTN|nr:GrpB family protein [Actinoplanes flavus]MBO3738698.1 GrpB family protein [Actinoplanes flavus]
MAEYPREITERFHGTPEQGATAMIGEPPQRWRTIVIEDHDPSWADRYTAARDGIRQALGDRILSIDHVGSTSVPGLAAKPIIDIDLQLAGTDDESTYVPDLERAGYRLLLREPWWHGHRMLISAAEDVHLHVWPPGAPEPIRHRLLRDWLRSHPADRDLYAATKRRLAADPDGYTLSKNDVIDQILARVFAHRG